jgi:carboxylesterase
MPRFLEGKNGEAVLLIHGFTGLPSDFYYTAERLNNHGYAVLIPRLPGHGTNAADFRSSRGCDWLRMVIDSYLYLTSRYKAVHLCGLSMGAVLAAITASQFPAASLILCAPAFIVSNKFANLSPILRYFIPSLRRSDIEEWKDKDMAYYSTQYWSRYFTAQIAELVGLQKRARKILSLLTANTYLIYAEKDRTVPERIEVYLESRLESRLKDSLRLTKSGHVVVNGSEKERAADAILQWIRAESGRE